MKIIRCVGLGLLLVLSLSPLIGDPDMRVFMKGVTQMTDSGKYEHALRYVDTQLRVYPENPHLLEYRRQLVELMAQTVGNLDSAPSTASTTLELSADSASNFTCETAEIVLLRVEPGTFLMCAALGSEDDTLVTLTRPYWLGRTEVTQSQWQIVMDNIPVPSLFKGSDRPVEQISWVSAMEFCQKVTQRERAEGRLPEGYEYTLPTEAEWEFAARAGLTTGGVPNPLDVAWFDLNSDRQTHPVAQKQPNAWGFYDMLGNVNEWCANGHDGYPGGHVIDPKVDYSGPAASSLRVYRGGSWSFNQGACRFDRRTLQLLNLTSSAIGFRLALVPTRPSTTNK